jgi:hypothetical protein
VDDQQWLSGFVDRTGYARLALFYLRHPVRTLRYLHEDLLVEAPQMRAENLSNFRKIDGHPPGARTGRFGLWTELRTAALRAWPEYLILWYIAVIGVSLFLARRSPAALICLGISVIGVLEFAVASLADTLETYRHLLLFHMITDITFCFALCLGIRMASRKSTQPYL